MAGKLTPRQAIFIAEYLLDVEANATRAAMAAGVPEKSAAVTASRWLKSKRIAAVIAERKAKLAVKYEITAERVTQELAKLAFHDPGNLYDAKGNLKPVRELDDMTRAAVASVEVDEKDGTRGVRTVTKKVKLADKGQNLERLGRYLKLFTDRTELTGRLTLEDLVCSDDGRKGGAAEAA
jgi:phage terminase small subunit